MPLSFRVWTSLPTAWSTDASCSSWRRRSLSISLACFLVIRFLACLRNHFGLSLMSFSLKPGSLGSGVPANR